MTDDMKKPSCKGSPRGKPFGPGNPGQRTGRMKGARNEKTIVREIANERHKVRIDGKARTMTTAELVVLALSKKAMAGDVRAATEINRLRNQHQPVETAAGTAGVLLVPDDISADEWIRQAEIRNRFSEKPPTMEGAGHGWLCRADADG